MIRIDGTSIAGIVTTITTIITAVTISRALKNAALNVEPKT
jgi:hypothetical protein